MKQLLHRVASLFAPWFHGQRAQNGGRVRKALILGKRAGVGADEPPGWRLVSADTLDEAQSVLAREEIPIVFCEAGASGLDWRRTVRLLAAAPCHPSVILLSPASRRPLWNEVTAVGGYDVLHEPLSADALDHVIRSATSHWRSRRALELERTPGGS